MLISIRLLLEYLYLLHYWDAPVKEFISSEFFNTEIFNMINPTIYDNLCIIFSEARLSTYLSATNEDKLEALKLYTLNMSLSESL